MQQNKCIIFVNNYTFSKNVLKSPKTIEKIQIKLNRLNLKFR